MSYLNSTLIRSHGQLKSRCCLITSRWQLKIASYGLSVFRKDERINSQLHEYESFKSLLWTAPELLRQGPDKPYYGTRKGDVYSYGIILQELVYRAAPFFMDSTSPKGILLSY